MRVLVDVGHPAHVHFFREARSRLMDGGHDVLVATRRKDVARELLDAYGIPVVYEVEPGHGPVGFVAEYAKRFVALRRLVRREGVDLLTGISSLLLGPLSRATGVPALVFSDTEHVRIERFTEGLAARYCTPYTFGREIGPNQVRYRGMHELAYVDPRRFEPDRSVLDELGVAADEPFAIARLVSWEAVHDRGHGGIGARRRAELLERLAARGRVFFSLEGPAGLPAGGEPLRLPPHRIHHALALARLYVGEGATMATEAGLLGTPSIYVSSLVGSMGNFERLEAVDLVRSFRDDGPAVALAAALFADAAAKPAWAERARAFAADHVDVSGFIVDEILAFDPRARGQTGSS